MKSIFSLTLAAFALSNGAVLADIFTGAGSSLAAPNSLIAESNVGLLGFCPVDEPALSLETDDREFFRQSATWHPATWHSATATPSRSLSLRSSTSGSLSDEFVPTVSAEDQSIPAENSPMVLAFSNSLIRFAYSSTTPTRTRSVPGSGAASINAVLVSVDDGSFRSTVADRPVGRRRSVFSFATRTDRLAPTEFQFPESER